MTHAFYFGCWEGAGHFLHDATGHTIYRPEDIDPPIPWNIGLMDSGLLENGKVPDVPDGLVRWTCAKGPWHAFYWWDRSGDSRSNSNSGFYVYGFPFDEPEQAFVHACRAFPHVVARQRHALALVMRDAR